MVWYYGTYTVHDTKVVLLSFLVHAKMVSTSEEVMHTVTVGVLKNPVVKANDLCGLVCRVSMYTWNHLRTKDYIRSGTLKFFLKVPC